MVKRTLRSHQAQTLAVMRAIASGEASGVRDVLAAVTPGGSKSLLPVLAAQTLIGAGSCERICWVVPRDSLRLQAEEAFADAGWRTALGHALSVRAAENAPDPCRSLAGYVTTYQGVVAAPADDDAGWSAAIEPLLALAAVHLFLSGTLERADGRRILGLPYRRAAAGREEVDLAAPGLAVVGYSRARALAERAVLPVSFGALDGEASWLGPEEEDGHRPHLGPHRLRAVAPNDATRPALFTALRTGFAEALLRRAFEATRRLRAERRGRLGLAPGEAA